jgi:hypothetical protein
MDHFNCTTATVLNCTIYSKTKHIYGTLCFKSLLNTAKFFFFFLAIRKHTTKLSGTAWLQYKTTRNNWTGAV